MDNGYADIKIIYRIFFGIKFSYDKKIRCVSLLYEYQLLTDEIVKVKKELGHKVYTKSRSLSKNHKDIMMYKNIEIISYFKVVMEILNDPRFINFSIYLDNIKDNNNNKYNSNIKLLITEKKRSLIEIMHNIFNLKSNRPKRYTKLKLNRNIEREIQNFVNETKHYNYDVENIKEIRTFVLKELVTIGFNMKLFDSNIKDYLDNIEKYKMLLIRFTKVQI